MSILGIACNVSAHVEVDLLLLRVAALNSALDGGCCAVEKE
jgi:hypothetical protein